MMQSVDPITCGYLVDQLAMCCGVGNRKRGRGGGGLGPQQRNAFFYSPSHVDHLNHRESSWALAGSHYAAPTPHQATAAASHQPYLLLTQPVIITTTTNHPNQQQQQHNTMALVQHAQTAPPNHSGAAPFPFYSIISSPQSQPHMMQPNIVSSQYAFYNMQAAATGGFQHQQQTPMATIQEQVLREQVGPLLNNNYATANSTSQNIYYNPKALLAGPLPAPTIVAAVPPPPPPPPTTIPTGRNNQQSAERKVATLSSEVFRQLELIERQIDLSADLETVEKYGIVITRALDPYSLMPHLTESTLREYNNQYVLNDGFVVRFVEIIKRPGQTLGLYIRTIRFEDHTREGQDSRTGVVITKIDTDSPVYNSPILHVGDEILSVNLVDVNGMSLDNVVVIMSIPRRLVLALRIPRDRLLTMDFMQQQQQQHLNQHQQQQQEQEHIMFRNPLDHHQQQQGEVMEGSNAAGSFVDMNQPPPRAQSASFKDQYYQQQQQHQINNPQKTFDDNQLIPPSSSSDIKQPSVISNIRLGDTPEQSSYFSSSIDAINRELKELRRQRMALSNNEQNLDSTRADF